MEEEFIEPRCSCFPTRAAGPGSSTPPEFQVEIADEYLEDVSFGLDHPADIIGFSLTPPQTLRAYRIGDKFQRIGKKTG
jgi:hypothetical protein